MTVNAPPAQRTDSEPFLILAPMRGLTDAVFRNAFADSFGGFHSAMAPFISTVSARRYKPSQLRDVLPENNRGPALIPQILSNDPEDFAALARVLFDLGYPVVNWNLGCPFRRVAGKLRGSGLLPHPDRIDAFLDQALAGMPNRLSIKTRLGRHKNNELLSLMPVFNRYPLAELIVHPRTGIQMYTGAPDLEAYGACLAATSLPVVFNGDIGDLVTFQTLSEQFPQTAGWMIGRGALANPWLPTLIRRGGRIGVPVNVETVRRFHDRLLDEYCRIFSGPAHPVDRMKGLWSYLSLSFADGRRFLKQVQKTSTVDRYRETVDRFFDTHPEWIA
ncbi:MAG: tRNA-dihydrouridine synthase family protein [Desulfobacterales bacterium]|nr:tRNA-dihydrouridine synthase family protein [Desulfobacterales bacterium]